MVSGLLNSRVTDMLEKISGKTLTRVRYRCLSNEVTKESDLDTDKLYIGGEVHLAFGRQDCVITWDENAGWEEHFSVFAGPSGLFLPEAEMEWWEVSTLKPWRNALDTRCESIRVLGQFNTPHMLELKFERSIIFVGDGSQHRFGDGDDVLVRGESEMPILSEWSTMWELHYAT